MPAIGLVVGGLDFSGLALKVGAVTLKYGKFLQTCLDFLIIAWAIFLIVKLVNRLKREEVAPAADAAPAAGRAARGARRAQRPSPAKAGRASESPSSMNWTAMATSSRPAARSRMASPLGPSTFSVLGALASRR